MAPLHSLIAFATSFCLLTAASPLADLDPRATAPQTFVNQTTCNGKTYTYQQLAGYGFVASNATDKYGDTLGGYGSAIAIDRLSWRKTFEGTYTGTLYAIPDRGWYVTFTSHYSENTVAVT